MNKYTILLAIVFLCDITCHQSIHTSYFGKPGEIEEILKRIPKASAHIPEIGAPQAQVIPESIKIQQFFKQDDLAGFISYLKIQAPKNSNSN